MYGCYLEVVFNVEVVFNFVAKARHHPNVVPVLFSVLIYIPTYSFIFLNVFFIILVNIMCTVHIIMQLGIFEYLDVSYTLINVKECVCHLHYF